MQWLIDIIKEWGLAQNFLTTSYVERPDYEGWDFRLIDLTADNVWHELDLSAIVPEGAVAVNLHVKGTSDDISACIHLRKHGYGWEKATCRFRLQIANHLIAFHPTVGISTDRKIDYKSTIVVWSVLSYLTVKGWWF